jgi:ABC-2 type transport system ATP-binding protein
VNAIAVAAGRRNGRAKTAPATARDVDPRRPAPREATIRLEAVAKHYGHGPDAIRALAGVSFAVRGGEAFALLGHNGAGKSTLIRTAATLLRPDAGRISIAGADVVGDPAGARRLLGIALQETGLPHRQTAARTIERHARLHGMSAGAARARAAELLAALALEEVSERAVSTYSGGQRRRLDLALALVHRPPVILLDEPTSGLDVSSRRAIWSQLHAQMRAGATVLFSTHDLDEAEAHADRVAIIHRGRLRASATPKELQRRCAEQTLAGAFERLTEDPPGRRG